MKRLGYYLKFVEDIDDRLKKVLKKDKEKYKAAGIKEISTLKTFIKAQLSNQFPHLGARMSKSGGVNGSVDGIPDFSIDEYWRHESGNNDYHYGQCTWYAAGAMWQLYGPEILDKGVNDFHNGQYWVKDILGRYPDKFEYGEVGSVPKVGAVFSTTNGGGIWAHDHVGVVIGVEGDQVTFFDGNYNGYDDDWEYATTQDWKIQTVSVSDMVKNFNAEYANPVDSIAPVSGGKNTASSIGGVEGVVFIGDSITSGMKGLIEAEGAYGTRAPGATVQNWLNGTKAMNMYDTWNTLPDDSDDITGVCVMLGTNNVQIQNPIDDMEKLLDKIQNKYPNKTIFVQKILPMLKSNQSKVDEYNADLEELCSKLDYAVFIDSTEGVELSADGVHPTSGGYKILFENTKINIEAGGGEVNWVKDPNAFQGSVRIRRVSPNKSIGEYKDVDVEEVKEKKENEGETGEGLGTKEEIPEKVKKQMIGVTVPEGQEDIFNNLSYLTIPYVNYEGEVKKGNMIVNKDLADEVLEIFKELYNIKYPIQNMKIVDEYKDDVKKDSEYNIEYWSIDDNNTYSFCYGGADGVSTGNAIQLNPIINPKVTNGNDPGHAKSIKYVDRTETRRWRDVEKKAYITKESDAYKIFEKYGWVWGGEDEENPNYMNFQKKITSQSDAEKEMLVDTRVYDLKYVPEETFNKYIEDNSRKALNSYTIDEDKKVVIASWSYSTDEGLKISKGRTIDYKKALSKYTMPLEYLLAVAMNTEDVVFTEGLANIAINSEYIVAIQDSVRTTKTDTIVTTSTKNVEGSEQLVTNLGSNSTTTTKINETASQQVEVTYVDCWFVKYAKDYSFSSVSLQKSENELNLSGEAGELIGDFEITAYCGCSICCGGYGATTATGTVPKQGLTIAVDPNVIPYGSYVSINDHIYHAEDTGGAINGNRIDIFFNNHQDALNWGRQTIPVYWAKDVDDNEIKEDDKGKKEEVVQKANPNPLSARTMALAKVSKSSSTSSTSSTSTISGSQESGSFVIQTVITTTKTNTISIKYSTGNYKISGNAEKFIKLYKNKKCKRVRRLYVPWLIDTLQDNEKTTSLIEITEYLFAQASGKHYNTSTLNFELYKPGEFSNMSASGGIPLYSPILSREDFIKAMEDYGSRGGAAFRRNFLPNAGEIYDVSVEAGVNPELVVVTAKTEQGFQAPASSPNNYWGIAVYNGQTWGEQFATLADGIRRYAEIMKNYRDNPTYVAMIEARYDARKDLEGIDNLAYGHAGTFAGMQSIYSGLGNHVYGGPSAGGYYILDPARTNGAFNSGGETYIYHSHEEFVEKCQNQHAAGSPVTEWENARYTQFQCHQKIDVWNDIFGEYGSLSSGISGGDLLSVAKEVWTKVCEQQPLYSMAWGKSVPYSDPIGYTDCSHFVSCVLYELGYTELAGGQQSTYSLISTNWNARYGWEEIMIGNGNVLDQLQPGDILVRDGHTCIVAEISGSKMLAYDCGSGSNFLGNNTWAGRWSEVKGTSDPVDSTYFATGNYGAGKIIRGVTRAN